MRFKTNKTQQNLTTSKEERKKKERKPNTQEGRKMLQGEEYSCLILIKENFIPHGMSKNLRPNHVDSLVKENVN